MEFCFREIIYGTKDGFRAGDERDFVIHIGAMWRELFSILWFEDVGIFSIFERYGGRDVGRWNGVEPRSGGVEAFNKR